LYNGTHAATDAAFIPKAGHCPFIYPSQLDPQAAKPLAETGRRIVDGVERSAVVAANDTPIPEGNDARWGIVVFGFGKALGADDRAVDLASGPARGRCFSSGIDDFLEPIKKIGFGHGCLPWFGHPCLVQRNPTRMTRRRSR
jgi:hypothetical protein